MAKPPAPQSNVKLNVRADEEEESGLKELGIQKETLDDVVRGLQREIQILKEGRNEEKRQEKERKLYVELEKRLEKKLKGLAVFSGGGDPVDFEKWRDELELRCRPIKDLQEKGCRVVTPLAGWRCSGVFIQS